MRMKAVVFVAVFVVAAGIAGVRWFDGRIDRAMLSLRYGSEDEQVEAMRLLAGHTGRADAFQAIVDWFESAAYRNPAPTPGVMAEAARAFVQRKPTGDGFAAAVAALQARGLFPEARTWVDDYEHSPAVTAGLLRHLVTSVPAEWPAAEANLQRELRQRPRDQVTLDLAVAAWKKGRLPVTVTFIETFDAALTEARVKAAAGTPGQGQDEWRLLQCQRRRCTRADVPHLINTARTDAGASPQVDPSLGSDGPSLPRASQAPLAAQRAALVSIGDPAVPALLELYDDGSRGMPSFAVATLMEIDQPAIVTRLAHEIHKEHGAALKAVDALQATPPDNHAANRLLMEALSSRSKEVSDVALASLQRRLDQQELVDGVLAFVADRERFTQGEVMAYENALKSAGPNAGSYVADTLTRMLDTAGDPRAIVWIQKVIALHVLRDVGADDALPVLARLRRDPGGYVWITMITRDGHTSESHRDVPFREASDDAVKAINQRSRNS